jgi:glutamyl-tRNA reductase
VTAQILAKLLHEPTVRMKQAAADGDGEAYAAAIRRLFALDEGL